MKCMIVAYDEKRGIGGNNDLLWHLPADLRHFKDLSTGTSVVMGRKTFESIGRALPNRQNIVVSHGEVDVEGVATAHSLPEAYALAEHDIFIIGGGMLYEQALSDADTVYATEVKAVFPEATVFFPELDESWQEISRESHLPDEKNVYAYDFVTFKRR